MSEYTTRGRIGLGTPQANPTVEPEFRRLVPIDVAIHTVRLTSNAAASNDRLVDYIEQLATTLRRFDTLGLDAFAFACTGSSYLVGRERELRIIDELTDEHGWPIHTATSAIHRSLTLHEATRIALVSPYPPDLAAAGRRYWEALGYEIVDHAGVDIGGHDTRGIYELGSNHALAALQRILDLDVDAFVFSGTGMPSLAAIEAASDLTDVPVLSSNLCLAALVTRAHG